MNQLETVISVVVISGAVGLAAGPTWSQGTPGSQPGGSPSGTSQPGSKMGSDQGRPGAAAESQHYSKETIKEVQEALKKQGHDPGTIDGTMNQKTQHALREFQQKNNLKATGNLNQETAQKLGVTLDEAKTGSQSGGAKGGTSGTTAGKSPGGAGGSPGTTQK